MKNFDQLTEQELLILVAGLGSFINSLQFGHPCLVKCTELAKLFPELFETDANGQGDSILLTSVNLFEEISKRLLEGKIQ